MRIWNPSFSRSRCLLPWGRSPTVQSPGCSPLVTAPTPGAQGVPGAQTPLSFLAEASCLQARRCCTRKDCLILSCRPRLAWLRCKPPPSAPALTVMKARISFLHGLPLALLPNWFTTRAGGKMLFPEPPQIPNSWQSHHILLPFLSDVSVSAKKLNLEIVLSLPAPLHLNHECLLWAPHPSPWLFQQHPSSLPASVSPLFFPLLPTTLPRRILPEWSQGHSCSLSKVNPKSQGGSQVLHEAAPPQSSSHSQHITLNSITTVHTPCCLLDKGIEANLEKLVNSLHWKLERLGHCWDRNTAKNKSSMWILFPRRDFKKFKDIRASVGKDGVTYLKFHV